MTVSGKPASRVLFIVFPAVIVLATAVVAVAIHQRRAIVHWLIEEVLAARGLAATNLAVEEVGLNRLVLSGVRTDLGGDLTFGRITVRYAPLEIFYRHIRRLEIQGIRFVVIARGDGGQPSIAIPESLLASTDGDGSDWTIGTVDLRDTRLAVEGPWTADVVVDGTGRHLEDETYGGTLRIRGSFAPPGLSPTGLDGTVSFVASPQELKELSGEFAADPLRLPEIASREGRLQARLRDGRLTLRSEVLTDDGRFDLEADGMLPEAFSPAAVSGTLRIAAERPPIPFLDAQSAKLQASVANGSATLQMEVAAREGHVRIEAEGPLSEMANSTALRGQATLDVDLVGLEVPGAPAPIAVKGRIRIVSGGEALTVQALEPLVAVLTRKPQPLSVRISPHSEPFLIAGPLGKIPQSAEVRIADGQVEAAGRMFAVGTADATVMIEPTRTILLREVRIRDLSRPPSIAALKLVGKASFDDQALRFRGTATGAEGRLAIDFDGSHRTDTNGGRATLRLHPLAFLPGKLQPRDLIPGLGDAVSAVDGQVDADGSLFWGRPAQPSDFTVRIKDISFNLDRIRVEGVSGKVVIDRPWPPRTPANQTLVFRRIDAGVPMTDATLRFRIGERNRLEIDAAQGGLLGGRFSIRPTVLDPASDRHRARMRFTGIDMESLLDIAEIDGATASGRLSGEIPLVVSGGGFSVDGGVLETDASGVLRYAPPTPPPALQGGGEGVSLILEALKNFHYDLVRATIDGRSGEEWSAKLHIEGKNPDFMDGYPFVFNLNLSGKLDEIIRTGLQSYELPAQIGKRISK